MTLAGVASYFLAAFAPLPAGVGLLLAFAFGPLLALSFLGWHGFLAEKMDGPLLRSACVAGLVAGAMVTAMLVVQVGNNMVRSEALAEAASATNPDVVRAAANASWAAVNRVQYLLDVVWDIFICTATLLLGWRLLGSTRFGSILGAAGIAAGALLLFFNLRTFPYGPGDVGSIDFGPLVAVWYLVAAIYLLRISRKPSP